MCCDAQMTSYMDRYQSCSACLWGCTCHSHSTDCALVHGACLSSRLYGMRCILIAQVRKPATPAGSRQKRGSARARTPVTQPVTPATPNSTSSAVSGMSLFSTRVSTQTRHHTCSKRLFAPCDPCRHLEVPGSAPEQLHANKHSLCRRMPRTR